MPADLKTSQENASGPVADADYFRGVQGGANVKVSFTKIKTWIKGFIGFGDLAGSVAAGQMPALTGEVTTSAGDVATTITAHAVTNAKMAQAGAATIKMNVTSGTADLVDSTIQGLSNLASPHATLDYILIYDHVSGTLKNAKPGDVAGVNTAGVATLNGASGTLAIDGASVSGSTIYAPQSGFVNKLRNSSLTSWFHGSGVLTITTSGGWGAEGLYIVPSGASVTAQQVANAVANPLSYYSQKIIGAASVTGVAVRFVVESYDAAPLAGQQVTFQVPVLNNTGGSITPTITVKQANAQDASYGTLISTTNLQTIADGASGTLSYSFAVGALGFLGLSIDIDFGNHFSSNAKSVQIGGGFDLRVTPGVATGTVSAPPVPEIRDAVSDASWNMRFYETSFSNGTAPGASTHTDIVSVGATSNGVATGSGGIAFKVAKRAAPSLSFWDGAGNASKCSARIGAAWFDNGGSTAAFAVTGLNSAVFDTGSTSTADFFIHYAADATLAGA
jgi:hypothetical protein